MRLSRPASYCSDLLVSTATSLNNLRVFQTRPIFTRIVKCGVFVKRAI